MMKADRIFKNAKIYTVNDECPWATAFVIKDGRFIYVGDDKGADAFEGPVTDLGEQFVMPGILDAHVHIAWGCKTRNNTPDLIAIGNNKAEVLASIKNTIAENPAREAYHFFMPVACLKGEKLTREDLDALCSDKPLLVVELEQHSRWMNGLEMKVEHIGEYDPDLAPGLSYCERDEKGRINGRIFEFNGLKDTYRDYSREVFEEGISILQKNFLRWGVIAVFDAGQATSDQTIDNFYQTFISKDEKGDLPFYVEGCYYIYDPGQIKDAVKELRKYRSRYASEHLNVRTAKIMMDGTHNGHTAALFEPYADYDGNGGTLVDSGTLKDFIIELNAEEMDLHVHTVGERAIATVLDAVEMARNELGASYHMQVTCAHVESIRLQDIGRFAKLGVLCNFTPHWFGGNCYGSYEATETLLGRERSLYTHRANSIWNTGATVSFGSDPITILDKGMDKTWSPYQGMEVGITRQDINLMAPFEEEYSGDPVFPPYEERLSLDQMIKGYTLNAAKQMRLDGKLGSIQPGKEASFLVFDKNLFEVDVYQLHKQLPKEVYIRGKLQ